MEIFILTLNGDTVKMSTWKTETIIDLKKRISDKLFMAPELQRILFHGHVLDDENSVEQFAIEDKSVITLVEGLRGSGITIFAATIDGRFIQIEIYPTETVLSLKKKIEKKLAIDPDIQKLVFKGEILNVDEDKLKDHAITDGSVINVIARLSGSGIRIFATTVDGRAAEIEIDPTETVLSLKKKIEEKLDFDTGNQELLFNGKILNVDEDKLKDHAITDGSVINVKWQRGSVIIIFVILFDGKLISVEIDPTGTVLSLKQIIEKKLLVHHDEMDIMYNGIRLNDNNKTLEDYSIIKFSTVLPIIRVSGCGKAVTIKASDGVCATLHFEEKETVLDLKKRIADKFYVAPNLQVLNFQGVILDNDKKKLSCYPFCCQTVIDLTAQISIRTFDGGIVKLDIGGTRTVRDLKKRIAEKFYVTPNLQVLNFQGVILDDDEKNLSNYPFCCQTVIDLTAHMSIRTSDGAIVKLEISGTRTVQDLKKRIATKLSLTIEELNLVFQDIVLEDDTMIASLKILKDSVISVHIKKRIYFEKDGKKIFLLVGMEEKVSDIKRKIREKAESSSDDIQLCYKAGRRLRDDKTLVDYGIEDTSEIRVLFLW